MNDFACNLEKLNFKFKGEKNIHLTLFSSKYNSTQINKKKSCLYKMHMILVISIFDPRIS